MATKIKPFKAVIYNQEKIKDISKATCPPYDVISSNKQQYYHTLSNYNFIHILLGRDVPGEDKYERGANLFKDWLKEEILVQDKNPAIYFYNQQYTIKGEKKNRLGFIALLHLGEENSSSAFRHEHTRLEAKEDRFKLLEKVRANLSPIFVVFSDKKRIIQRVYQQDVWNKLPAIEIKDEEGVTHQLWRIDSPDTLRTVESAMEKEGIFIADGHHRYEVACAYRDKMKEKLGTLTGEESFNYLLTYFTNTDPNGLSILPIHRLVKLDTGLKLESFILSLKDYFDVEEVKDKARFFFLMEKAGRTEHLLGMYKDGKYWFLRLKNIKILDKELSDKSKDYRSLDVAILNTIVLKKILGLDLEDKKKIIFSPHADDFINEVNKNHLYIAFFLNPVKIQQIMSVALNGERMPAKSTYFYPKVLSGLVINKFEE